MRERVDYARSGDREPDAPESRPRVNHRVYYDEGVGTGPFAVDRYFGGAFGLGLDRNIREAYRFLSQMYEPGDEIYVFGFSRGAFTARSLVGYVAASGLLQRHRCSRSRERQAWRYYRTPPKARYPAIRADLDRDVHQDLRVKCLGVFDTVGALGIPLTGLNTFNRWRYQFHDTALGSIVDNAFQALALDEPRWPFRPSVWTRPTHNRFKRVEQAWFAGGHSDVGGGNVYNGEQAAAQPLSSIALDWMIRRVEATSGLRFAEPAWVLDPLADQHEAFKFPYRLFGRTVRVVNKTPPATTRAFRLATIPAHLSPIGEVLHVSVLQRLGRDVILNGSKVLYAPANVLALVEIVEASYRARGGPAEPQPSMKIVDWDGGVLDPADEGSAETVLALLRNVRARLGEHRLLGRP